MNSLHWIRPYWLMALIPCFVAAYCLWRHQGRLTSWSDACDPHLLQHQLIVNGKQHRGTMLPLIFSLLFMVLGLAGPSWIKLPTPTYQTVMPRVIILDMSSNMFEKDVKPSRLFRAKLLIRDILSQTKEGQVALIAYSGMPFVVSPLTQDSNTIETLLSSLTDDVMPIGGHDMAAALQEGRRLVEQAGFTQADLLVITANQPSSQAIDVAAALAKDNFQTALLPIPAKGSITDAERALASAGNGMIINFDNPRQGIRQWFQDSKRSHQLQQDKINHIPLWQDEGHWLMLLALICLLPLFQRGRLEAGA